jgi:hypothetical protein
MSLFKVTLIVLSSIFLRSTISWADSTKSITLDELESLRNHCGSAKISISHSGFILYCSTITEDTSGNTGEKCLFTLDTESTSVKSSCETVEITKLPDMRFKTRACQYHLASCNE